MTSRTTPTPFGKTAISASIAMMPLSISVVPWGILCGTLCVEAGMNSLQAQLMSLAVFAGAAQISGVAIMGATGSWISLINSTTMISVRHMLYSATYKEHIAPLPFLKRVVFAFLLTDEMFAVAQTEQMRTGYFNYNYAVIAGFVFYIIWNIATFVGIVSANLIRNIDQMGFDFAIAATFIAMVVPMLKDKVIFIAALVSAITALIFEMMGISQGIILSGLLGMAVGAILSSQHQ